MTDKNDLDVLYDWLFYYEPHNNLWVAVLKEDYNRAVDDPSFVAMTMFATSIDTIVDHITNGVNPIN